VETNRQRKTKIGMNFFQSNAEYASFLLKTSKVVVQDVGSE